MWEKCGTKILNEINKVKKSTVFFGSDIYHKKTVFVSFALRSAQSATKSCVGSNSALQRRF
jgi:hypothetical protein